MIDITLMIFLFFIYVVFKYLFIVPILKFASKGYHSIALHP